MMGNVHSDVTAGVKSQADVDISKQRIYSLINVKRGGILVEIMKNAIRKRDFSGVDDRIYELVKPFLYNGGDGKKVPISKLIRLRNKERPNNKRLPIVRREERDCEEDSEEKDERINFVWRTINWFRRVKPNTSFRRRSITIVVLLNYFHVLPIVERQYREVCWSLAERGSVGETALHICFLVSTPIHIELARRLVRLFPKLVNDIYVCDEYYGEGPLHMAVVNEDPSLVKCFLHYGADVNGRSVGNFFCAYDQRDSRIDNLEHEHYILKRQTNYQGHAYWGEYPLSFAACLELEDCYRILYAYGADPDNVDTNGNTVLHMTVIVNKMKMFNLAYELGADLYVKNKLNLTPLSLAARLTRKEMFFHILKLQREVYWQFCDVAFASYPLEEIDSINVNSGQINNDSALSVVAFGDEIGHLDLFEGLLIDILQSKWNTFVKKRFYFQIILFGIYFVISFFAFILRPPPLITSSRNHTSQCVPMNNSNISLQSYDSCEKITFCPLMIPHNSTILNITMLNETFSLSKPMSLDNNSGDIDYCYLLYFDTPLNKLRRLSELMTAIGAIMYLTMGWKEGINLSWHIFFHTLVKVPGRVMFFISCILIVISIPMRFACIPQYEDRIVSFIMFLTPMHFLFFCRGFRSVGPFVVMIYKMLISDLLCFVIIYMIFVFGFAEAFFVIFRSHRGNGTNYFDGVVDSVMSMFLMSLNEFVDIYNEFDKTDHPYLAKLLFIVYMILVSILLVNMLIAMMGKTYQDIASRPNEWLRQWARIILVVERGVSPKRRLKFQQKYSEIREGKRVFIKTWETNENEKSEIENIKEIKQSNAKIRTKRESNKINGNRQF